MIEIKNLKEVFNRKNKKIKNFEALKNIELKINDGEVVALLGSNGSGKSTLLKIMSGVINPTEGAVIIDGKEIFGNRKKMLKYMGIIFSQKSSLIPDITAKDNLIFYGLMYDLKRETIMKRIEELEEIFNIEDFMDTPIRRLSFGQRMKVELVSILLHRPKYIFLDEPTIGLDIFVKEELLALIKKYNRLYKSTIIITTHEIELLDGVCSRVVLLDKGEVIMDKTPEEIQSIFHGEKVIDITYSKIFDEKEFGKLVYDKEIEEVSPNRIKLKCKPENKTKKIKALFDMVHVVDFKEEQMDLKEGIVKLYEKIN